jgi:6,7-dimethyl-8-ribityllumazine synthase
MARILIVEARFYGHLNDLLLAGAKAALAGHDVEVVTVPGALEIPGAVALAGETGRYDAYVALGVVIRGETYHFEIVAGESARGLMALSLDGLAIGNGILTVEDEAQALARADPAQKDKGGEAAKAALAMLRLREQFPPTDAAPASADQPTGSRTSFSRSGAGMKGEL